MAFNMKDLNKLAKFARKNGITHIKVDGVEMQVHAAFLDHPVTAEVDEKPQETLPHQYTDEQILNWSSTSYVEGN